MKERVERPLGLLTDGAVWLGFFSAFPHVEPAYAAGFASLFVLSWLQRRSGRFSVPPWIVNGLAVATLLLALGRLELPSVVRQGTEVLLILTALKGFDRRAPRDYFLIQLLVVFTLAGSAILSLDWTFLPFLVAFLFQFGVAAVLLAGWSEDPAMTLDRPVLRSIVRGALWIPALAIPVAAALFVLLPRTADPFLELVPRRASAVAGFTDEVVLGRVSGIQESGAVAFRVRMERLAEDDLYWRGVVFDGFDGQRWTSRRDHGGFLRENVRLTGRLVAYTVFLEPSESTAVFTLDKPRAVSLRGLWGGRDFTFSLYRPVSRTLRYDAESVVTDRLPDGTSLPERYLQVPPGMERIGRLARDVAGPGSDEGERIERLLRFFHGGDFRYTIRNLPVSDRPLEAFLFDHREGNCEYFASALTVLLRLSGIPARMVGGYRGGYYQEAGGFYTVPQRNAHVWVEAYREGREWVRLDPTPASAETFSGTEGKGILFRVRLVLDLFRYSWDAFVIDYDLRRQIRLFSRAASWFRKPAGLPGKEWLWAFALAALLAAAAAAAWIARRKGRLGRTPEERILAAFARRMEILGYPRDPVRGLEEFAAAVPDPRVREDALRFVRRFQQSFYRDRRLDARDLRDLRILLEEIGRTR